jgi:Tfp pilus assembly protein PilF
MLLDLGRRAQARTEFEATLKKEPNRFRALYGAARAASLSGDRESAGRYYAQLLDMCARADGPLRPALAESRRTRTPR